MGAGRRVVPPWVGVAVGFEAGIEAGVAVDVTAHGCVAVHAGAGLPPGPRLGHPGAPGDSQRDHRENEQQDEQGQHR
ncbi:hypothetical protein CcI49_29385 [Frankia sp. CcI49]|nr:hypothetical protein ACG83_22620 [Frankia sp. R43]ONH54824.1 hypothetical protein CcI49_29385 [Frankia sp. CcI49]